MAEPHLSVSTNQNKLLPPLPYIPLSTIPDKTNSFPSGNYTLTDVSTVHVGLYMAEPHLSLSTIPNQTCPSPSVHSLVYLLGKSFTYLAKTNSFPSGNYTLTDVSTVYIPHLSLSIITKQTPPHPFHTFLVNHTWQNKLLSLR